MHRPRRHHYKLNTPRGKTSTHGAMRSTRTAQHMVAFGSIDAHHLARFVHVAVRESESCSGVHVHVGLCGGEVKDVIIETSMSRHGGE